MYNSVSTQNTLPAQSSQTATISNANQKFISYSGVSPQNLAKEASKSLRSVPTSVFNTEPAPASQTAEIFCDLCLQDVDQPLAKHMVLQHPG